MESGTCESLLSSFRLITILFITVWIDSLFRIELLQIDELVSNEGNGGEILLLVLGESSETTTSCLEASLQVFN